MKEYPLEKLPNEDKRENVDRQQLIAEPVPIEHYVEAHKGLIIACHDIILAYNCGALLVQRDNDPAKGELWPIGGKLARGLSAENSLKLKVREECGLELEEITFLGVERTLFFTDPFGHGKGTDSINLMYCAKGVGEVNLNKLHSRPTVVKPEAYTAEFRATLHPYVQDIMDLSMPYIEKWFYGE